MSHPFDFERNLDANDLDFELDLTDREAEQVGGGLTIAPGEPYPAPVPYYCHLPYYPYPRPHYPVPTPYPVPHHPEPGPSGPDTVTTLALGEEGGSTIY